MLRLLAACADPWMTPKPRSPPAPRLPSREWWRLHWLPHPSHHHHHHHTCRHACRRNHAGGRRHHHQRHQPRRWCWHSHPLAGSPHTHLRTTPVVHTVATPAGRQGTTHHPPPPPPPHPPPPQPCPHTDLRLRQQQRPCLQSSRVVVPSTRSLALALALALPRTTTMHLAHGSACARLLRTWQWHDCVCAVVPAHRRAMPSQREQRQRG